MRKSCIPLLLWPPYPRHNPPIFEPFPALATTNGPNDGNIKLTTQGTPYEPMETPEEHVPMDICDGEADEVPQCVGRVLALDRRRGGSCIMLEGEGP